MDFGALGNFSLSGFEMVLTRYVSTYIITYYLPSGIHKDKLLLLPKSTYLYIEYVQSFILTIFDNLKFEMLYFIHQKI